MGNGVNIYAGIKRGPWGLVRLPQVFTLFKKKAFASTYCKVCQIFAIFGMFFARIVSA